MANDKQTPQRTTPRVVILSRHGKGQRALRRLSTVLRDRAQDTPGNPPPRKS